MQNPEDGNHAKALMVQVSNLSFLHSSCTLLPLLFLTVL